MAGLVTFLFFEGYLDHRNLKFGSQTDLTEISWTLAVLATYAVFAILAQYFIER